MVGDRGVAGNQSQPKESLPVGLVTPGPVSTSGRARYLPPGSTVFMAMAYDTTLVADRHLLDRLARGAAEALRALYRRHGSSRYALAYGRLAGPGVADAGVAGTCP